MRHNLRARSLRPGWHQGGKLASRLLVASYFSWNLGTALQKTHVGLLRSLLHDIFSQIPDLVPTTHCRNFSEKHLLERRSIPDSLISSRASRTFHGKTFHSKFISLSMESTNSMAITPRSPVCLHLYRTPTSSASFLVDQSLHAWTFSQSILVFVFRT